MHEQNEFEEFSFREKEPEKDRSRSFLFRLTIESEKFSLRSHLKCARDPREKVFKQQQMLLPVSLRSELESCGNVNNEILIKSDRLLGARSQVNRKYSCSD